MSTLPSGTLVDILCKVVDNYGDIGVVYRLAKALSDMAPDLRLRLHVDDLGAFRALCPGIDPAREVQSFRGWTILRWNAGWEGLERERPRLVLECFACGRPDRLEELLFDPGDPTTRRIVNIGVTFIAPTATGPTGGPFARARVTLPDTGESLDLAGPLVRSPITLRGVLPYGAAVKRVVAEVSVGEKSARLSLRARTARNAR